MVTRYDVPETVASLRKVNQNGVDTNYEDCACGIEIHDGRTMQIDLRNLRPIRVNDRENQSRPVICTRQAFQTAINR